MDCKHYKHKPKRYNDLKDNKQEIVQLSNFGWSNQNEELVDWLKLKVTEFKQEILVANQTISLWQFKL